ncbi:TPM domain-containing protein [Candidatus Woesearchaeota archaeon]|nr:TPM domain-containing protein [Candidatus Woesearchaeota archaeon]
MDAGRTYAAFLIIVASAISGSALEKLYGLVNDEAGIISPEEEQQLQRILEEIEQNTTAEVAVATVNSLEGQPIEEYSMKLAHKTLGEKDKDNGILILAALKEREYRIEIGYGLEGIINDAKAGRIGRQNIEPNFAKGEYGKGLIAAAIEISAILKKEQGSQNQPQGKPAVITAIEALTVFLLYITARGFLSSATGLAKEALSNKKEAKKQAPAIAGLAAYLASAVLIVIIMTKQIGLKQAALYLTLATAAAALTTFILRRHKAKQETNDFRAARIAWTMFGGRGNTGFGGGRFGGGGFSGRF